MKPDRKRWSITGHEAVDERRALRSGRLMQMALPARVRLHLLPGGTPLETSDAELLRRLHEDLGRAIEWLEERNAYARLEADPGRRALAERVQAAAAEEAGHG